MKLRGLLSIAAIAGVVIGTSNLVVEVMATREVFDLAELKDELKEKPKEVDVPIAQQPKVERRRAARGAHHCQQDGRR